MVYKIPDENDPTARLHYGDEMHKILDENGQPVGFLYKDPRLRAAMSSRGRSDHKMCEFLGLSVSCTLKAYCLFPEFSEDINAYEPADNGPLWKRVQNDRTLNLNFFDGDGVPLHYAPVVNVMLIESVEELAHRVALGWIVMTKWAKADRQVKIIALK